MKAIPHNYRSDITLIEIFYRYDEKKNEMVATEIPDIEIDFEFTYRAEDHREFTAGRKAGTYFNCKPVSNNSIEVYIPLSRRQLGTGLVGGGTLSSNVTLSLEEVATEGTYTKVHIDALGRVKQGECLGVADIPDLPWSKLTGHPTTIAGYGITDAKISGGTITLGGNSITPLTAHQSLVGYYTKVESDMRYLSRSGGSMLNTNLVGNLNADMLDGKHLAEILSSNVASATKLQTPRTLWGQSFNGTANVSGNMTGVGSITASGEIRSTKGIFSESIVIDDALADEIQNGGAPSVSNLQGLPIPCEVSDGAEQYGHTKQLLHNTEHFCRIIHGKFAGRSCRYKHLYHSKVFIRTWRR